MAGRCDGRERDTVGRGVCDAEGDE
jgi:hypothetical protein